MNSAIRTGVVSEFRGEYYFLSNYYTAPFEWRGIKFTSGEQAFAYAKTFFMSKATEEDRRAYIRAGQAIQFNAQTPGEAKKMGRQIKIDVDQWDANKVSYMREIVHAKFRYVPGLAGKLINTGAMLLVEGNNWNDKFWGRCLDKQTGKMVGLNTLGTILMEERGYWLHSDFSDTKEN